MLDIKLVIGLIQLLLLDTIRKISFGFEIEVLASEEY
tara:strand:+ start:330 stop:440 length:111 start_codon:yes stop_codon:yes gene_type:complete